MDAAADAVILCITKIYRACPARRLKGQEPRRERKREREDGKRGQGQGRTNVYYVRYSKTEKKRDGGGREREKCVRTVIAMQWEQHAEQHNGGEGGPSLPALLLSPLDFVTLSGHGAVCVAFGHFRRGRAHLRCTYVRMSSETAVLEPPTQSRQRWLLRCPRGSKRPVCVASRPRVVGAGVIYPMDIYIYCYHAARLPGFSAGPTPLSLSLLSFAVDGRRQRRRRMREMPLRGILPRNIDDEEAIASPAAGKLLAVIGKLRNANVTVIIRRTSV